MTLPEYKQFADELAREAGVFDGLHGYFLQHRSRLWQTASHFDLWNLRGKSILEIGPFFSYTPFVLKKQGNELTVLEGDDPAVYPLKPLYQARGIEFKLCSLFDNFATAPLDQRQLPVAANQFDVVSCWETMEHFNFNPVGFIRDLHRVLKPGGTALITVPNMAELENRVKLFFGRSIAMPVDGYWRNYEYAAGSYLGFHWREYVLSEIADLFGSQNFFIVSANHLQTFQDHPNLTASRKIKRLLAKSAFSICPSLGSLCTIVVKKPS